MAWRNRGCRPFGAGRAERRGGQGFRRTKGGRRSLGERVGVTWAIPFGRETGGRRRELQFSTERRVVDKPRAYECKGGDAEVRRGRQVARMRLFGWVGRIQNRMTA